MSTVVRETSSEHELNDAQPLYNDAVITIATKNGSGSQSANLILMRAIFKMGIPVSVKNLFPSNIAGLPTWFTIRANEDGWLARRAREDILVAMNGVTVAEDIAGLAPGSTVIVNDSLKHALDRDDLIVHEVPFSRLVREACPDSKLRKRVINVVYVGVLAWLLDIDPDVIDDAISYQFGGKEKAVAINRDAAMAGYDWAKENLPQHPGLRFRATDKATDMVVIEGNEAIAMGLLFGGTTVLAWYPITPSSGVCENLMDYLGRYRLDPESGKATFAVVQTEDEIASIGVVLGAGWAGARAVTATSGPGLSLMAEMAGLSYFAEIPAVVVDVQRMGPSTGLPTRTAQGDITCAYNLSHGDAKHVLLIPGDVKECFEFAMQALDLAEHMQTIVFVMSDLDLGMNPSLSKPFDPPSPEPLDRGKVLNAEDLDRVGSFERYRDVDGDGISYRTLPGTEHENAAYFTRGTGHRSNAEYSESSEVWRENMDRLKRKFETARAILPVPIIDEPPGARIGIIGFGSSDLAIAEARHQLHTQTDMPTSYLRIRALPPSPEIRAFVERHDEVYLVEQNRDGQMVGILRAEFPEIAAKLKSIVHYNGLPIDAATVADAIMAARERT